MPKTSQLQELGMAFYQSRSQADFNKMYQRMKISVGFHIKDILPSSDDREDAVANTFAKVWTKIDMYDPYWNFSTWVYAIARNEALLMLRHKRRNYSLNAMIEKGANMESRMAITMPKGDTSESDLYASSMLYDHALSEIHNLPETYRIVMVMREIERKKYGVIAKELGWKENTVRTRIRKGRELLRKSLTHNYPDLVSTYSEQIDEQ